MLFHPANINKVKKYPIPWAPKRNSAEWNQPQHVSDVSVCIGLRRIGMRFMAGSTEGKTSTHAAMENAVCDTGNM